MDLDLSDAFQQDVRSLIDLSPSILSPLSANNQQAGIFYEKTSSLSLLGEATFPTRYSSSPIKEHLDYLQGCGIHTFTPSSKKYSAVPGPPTRSGLQECSQSLLSSSPPVSTFIKLDPPQSLPRIPHANLVSDHEKKQLIHNLLESAFSYQPDLLAASVEYQERIQQKCMINSNGRFVVANQEFLGLRLKVKHSIGGKEVEGMSTYFSDFENGMFLFSEPFYLIKEAISQAITLSSALPIRSGSLPVIFEGSPTSLLSKSTGNASIWLHETIGHLLEADQYISHPCAPLEEQLTSVPLSLSDNPFFGSQLPYLGIDDEGTAGKNTDLIVDGRLKQVLTDSYHSSLLDAEHTGNGRRQDYRFPPLPRMTTLHLHPGQDSNEALISSVKQGIYIKKLSQGHTFADTQHVELRVNEGYYIENGRLTHPITNVTIEGKGINILDEITGIGDDLPPQPLTIQCKKNQQVVPVAVASPTVLIKQMDVYQHS